MGGGADTVERTTEGGNTVKMKRFTVLLRFDIHAGLLVGTEHVL